MQTQNLSYILQQPGSDKQGDPNSWSAEMMFFSGACFSKPVAQNITLSLKKYLRLSEQLAQNIHTCLHEAIANAIIHGNLGLPGSLKTEKPLPEYYQQVEERLKDSAYFFTRVNIMIAQTRKTLFLDVQDEGCGYPHHLYFSETSKLQPHQGISLIRNSCSSAEVRGCGNHIHMEFAL